jgi:hypothetical protein
MDEAWVNTNSQNSQNSPQPELGGSHHLPPYSIFCAWPWDLHSNVILPQDSQLRNPEISEFPEIGTLMILKAHNFLYIPSIEMKSKVKL